MDVALIRQRSGITMLGSKRASLILFKHGWITTTWVSRAPSTFQVSRPQETRQQAYFGGRPKGGNRAVAPTEIEGVDIFPPEGGSAKSIGVSTLGPRFEYACLCNTL